jgi:hypothetical protein
MPSAGDVISLAELELGKPYIYGDEGPSSFDCSGLTQFVFHKAGVDIPRTAHEQQAWAKPVSNPQPGDLVFYGSPAHHVGLYIGGGKMIDAPGKNLRVRVEGIGHPTSYGRVPGVGSALETTTGVLGDIGSWVGDVTGVSKLLEGGRRVVLEGAFVALGLVLVGLGVYKTVQPQLRKIGDEVL